MLILLFWVGIFYVVITLCVLEDTGEGFIALLWPLVFIKYMLKGLFKVLFTGWRD